MAARDRKGGAVAIVGGAALAMWLLSRGRGWRVGNHGDGSGTASATNVTARPVVWVRADRIEVDGAAADLTAVIARARAAGEAEVHATGDAIHGVVANVLRALRTAGVTIYTTPDLASIVPAAVLS